MKHSNNNNQNIFLWFLRFWSRRLVHYIGPWTWSLNSVEYCKNLQKKRKSCSCWGVCVDISLATFFTIFRQNLLRMQTLIIISSNRKQQDEPLSVNGNSPTLVPFLCNRVECYNTFAIFYYSYGYFCTIFQTKKKNYLTKPTACFDESRRCDRFDKQNERKKKIFSSSPKVPLPGFSVL